MEIRLSLGAQGTAARDLALRLDGAARQLATEGVAVPAEARLHQALAGGLRLATWGPWPLDGAAQRLLRRRFAGLAGGADLLVIAGPDPLGPPGQFSRPAAFYPFAARRLEALAGALPAPPSTVMLGLRAYADFHPAIWSDRVRAGRVPPLGDAARGRLIGLARGWPDLVRLVARVFAGARLVLWDHDALTEDFGETEQAVLAAMVGAAAAERVPPLGVRPWARLSHPAAQEALILSSLGVPVDPARAQMLSARWPRERYTAFDPWRSEERDALDTRYRRDLAAIRKAHPGALLQRLPPPRRGEATGT